MSTNESTTTASNASTNVEGLPNPFEEGTVTQVIAGIFARDLEEFRKPDGTLTLEQVEKFCSLYDVDLNPEPRPCHWDPSGFRRPIWPLDPADLAATTTLDAATNVFWEWLGEADPEYREELFDEYVGTVETIASWDSSSYGVMTCGSGSTGVVRKDGWVGVYEEGIADLGEIPYIDCSFRESDDPGLRNTRLAAVSEFGGLLPGVWVEGADDLGGDLRDVTLGQSEFTTWYSREFEKYVGVDLDDLGERIEAVLPEFARNSGLNEEQARHRLAALLPTGKSETPAERDAIWTTWKWILDRSY